jgi:hypothetical protein
MPAASWLDLVPGALAAGDDRASMTMQPEAQ